MSSHYIIFFYKDVDNVDYRFVVLPSTSTAPADYAAIGAFDGHITLKATPSLRAGMIFLPGSTTLDSDGVPTATLAASSTYKLYAAKDGGEVKSIDVKTGARGPESPFRVRYGGSPLTRIYVGKKYGIVPFSDYRTPKVPTELVHTPSGGSRTDMTVLGVLVANYAKVANIHDPLSTPGGLFSDGVLLFLNSTADGVNVAARNLGRSSIISVLAALANNGGELRLRFSDDNENQRSITNAQGFATSPAVN